MESHARVEALYIGDEFEMEDSMSMIYDYFPTSKPENDAEMIKILQGLINGLGSLDKAEIEKNKKELKKFLEEKGAPSR